MCGIVAVAKHDGSPVNRRLLTRMRDSMTHRGPDDAGIYVDESIGLGHRRLSILDLSPAGHQPMCNEDRSVWLTFNGEIYNYVELAADLRQRGHAFRSHSDSEVIIHLYEEMGARCVRELNGMFAFVIWDARRRRLFGARDRMGIKPFYYYSDDRQFVCASEMKAIVEDPAVRREPDPRAIADYLFAGAPLAGKTFFAGIHELPPGHTVIVEHGRVRTEAYWDVRYDYRASRSTTAVVHELTELLEDSVKIHCRSDAPVGSHLSGGLDSSAVASLAARFLDPFKTFSIRFDVGGYYDETAFAKRVSEAVGSEYIEATAVPEALCELYAPLMWHMDQPPAGGSDAGFSYYNAARLAADHVKVTLTGHGGDEIFAGYPAQFETAFGANRAFPDVAPPAGPASHLNRLIRLLRYEGLGGIAHRLGRRVAALKESPEDLWIRLHCNQAKAENSTFHKGFLTGLDGYSPRADYLRPFQTAPTDQLLDRCLYHDLRVYLPQLLHKEDRASMAVSIESRLPLLDHRIVELMATVPPEQKVPGLIPKALLRQASAKWLPREIFERRDKVPFAVPMHEWHVGVLSTLIRRTVMSPSSLDRGIFDADMLRSGRLSPNELHTVLNVELWFRIYIDQDLNWPDVRTVSAGPTRSRKRTEDDANANGAVA